MFSFNPSAYRVKRLLFAAFVVVSCTLFWYQFDIIRERTGLSEATWIPKLSGNKSAAPTASKSHAQSVSGHATSHVPIFLEATPAAEAATPTSASSSARGTGTTAAAKATTSSIGAPSSIVPAMESAQFTSTATGEAKPAETQSDPLQKTNKEENATFLELAPKYHQAFLNPADESFKRMECPAPTHDRYNYLRGGKSTNMTATRRKYFFALNLHQNTPVLPRLMGSVVEAMRFLGTEHCALSIVEGRSDDGTYEILKTWKTEMEKLGVPYYFTSSDVDPMAGDRIGSLAILRNGALQHLMDHPKEYSADAAVIFLNDIAICMEDILELVHQRLNLGADMVCGMDWIDHLGTFYDVWVSRTLTGDFFFPIPGDGSWDQSWMLFASDENAKARFDQKLPFQVFACWNGGAVFTAKPIQEAKLKFRTSRPGECFAGEPTVFCKDMWWHGYGKIAVIPTVNVDYTDAGASHVKEVRGRVSGNLPVGGEDSLRFDWQDAPDMVKCAPNFQTQTWVPWNESMADVPRKP